MTIWDLDNFKMVEHDHLSGIYSFTTLHYDEKLVLACGHDDGYITVLSVSDYSQIKKINARGNAIHSLDSIRYNDNVCLVYPGYKTIKFEY